MKDYELQVDPDGRTFTTIRGVRVEVVDHAEAEESEYVVCGPASYFADDVHTLCAFCSAGIVHRPYVPARPPKICMPCMRSIVEHKES